MTRDTITQLRKDRDWYRDAHTALLEKRMQRERDVKARYERDRRTISRLTNLLDDAEQVIAIAEHANQDLSDRVASLAAENDAYREMQIRPNCPNPDAHIERVDDVKRRWYGRRGN